MALNRVLLLVFLLKTLPFCSCSDPYCALDGENQYSYEEGGAVDDYSNSWMSTNTGRNDEVPSASIVCPNDADTCFSYSFTIERCQTNSSFSPEFYCNCDSDCDHFEDCCYGHRNENASMRAIKAKFFPEKQYWSCTSFTIGIEWSTACIRDVLVVSICPSSARTDLDLVQRCEQPLANDTVFFDSKEIFYRNRYCALCHSVNSSELTPYIIFTPCLDNRQTESNLCGQRPFLVNGSAPPPIRWCFHDSAIISHCDSQTGAGVPCLNETERVIINGSIYKNIDCAECNGVSVDNSSSLRSNCEFNLNGLSIPINVPYNQPAFEITYFYPQLQCMNGLQLSGTECVPEVGSWPDCRNRNIILGVITNGSLQCFDGFEILKIWAYNNYPNTTIYELKEEEYDGSKVNFMMFPANIVPQKTQLEGFTESILGEKRGDCCRDNNIIIYEVCDIEYELSTGNNANLTRITDDIDLFEPVLINGTTYIMYNHTTFVTPLYWENNTYYRRLSREWKFPIEQSFSLHGEIVDIDTCAFIVVGNSLITENERNNVTYLIYQDIPFPPESYIRYLNGSVRLCWTGPDPPEPVGMFEYSKGQNILNLILAILSSICLLATLLTYCIFKPLRNLQGLSIMSFVSAFFVAQVMLQFIAPNMISLPTVCTIAATIAHYFLLAVFTWTNILAWDLVRHFASSSFLPKRHGEMRRLIAYLIIGWCLPLVIVVPCLIIQVQNPSLFRYGKIGTSCWIYQARAIVLAFLVPFAVSFLVNIVLFSLTVYGVHKSKRDSSALHEGAHERRKELFHELVVHFKISCLLGFGWSFGFIAAFAQAAAVWTIFIITSSLQGVFVFVFFGANHRVRGLWRKRIRESKSEGRSTSTQEPNLREPVGRETGEEKDNSVGFSPVSYTSLRVSQ
ncbi:uncharacterized protein LOC115923590 [Strongylocentrotus purpuratus]|uniref:Uncharacterized protein n=1 Tax=Strongylocentrotus purpuratus TaxID=7668 RepID=A0A7M7NR32_STRPU|nr:uncharacterized protein LOC115923590 [Strongylocentrotus purpuratus]